DQDGVNRAKEVRGLAEHAAAHLAREHRVDPVADVPPPPLRVDQVEWELQLAPQDFATRLDELCGAAPWRLVGPAHAQPGDRARAHSDHGRPERAERQVKVDLRDEPQVYRA